ncbi:MAG: hypothetical protein HY609_03820, partial [Deltaproteobacteria bacterium]|nr:hypothetical protein [Deltaproteobacteria bacterium]
MVDRIDTKFTRLPPAWLSRAARTSGNIGQSEEIRKLLGEPIPRKADLHQLSPRIAEMFDSNGILE